MQIKFNGLPLSASYWYISLLSVNKHIYRLQEKNQNFGNSEFGRNIPKV